MDNFRKELKDLLTRYPQVESLTYKCVETITKDSVTAVNMPKVTSTELGGMGTLPPTAQMSVIEAAIAGMRNVTNQ